jgi:phthalate 4,5-dioxygenase oxygenase subunit
MLTARENEILTRVGPDQPMGRMMRRYWLPICASSQIAGPDSKPLRAQLLGESFVVFRDTAGKVGVLDEFCMHRGVSLALGRVEKHGIRCLYHGWKFGVDGTIQDTPNHCSEHFKARLKAPAYPVREEGGLVWTYIGPKEKIPPFQRYAFMEGPEENRVVIRINANANYLQLYEGGTDSSHVGILHSNLANPGWLDDEFIPGDEDYNPGALSVGDNAPTLEIEDTEYGYHYVAKRQGPARPDGRATHSIRITPVIFPTGRIIPAPSFQFFVFEVPQDDHNTSTYLVCHGPKRVERADILRIMGLDDPRFWREEDCNFRATWDDNLGQDRDAMARNWSGYSGIEQEDVILAISMGPIIDRTKEHLVAADRAVVHLRARLLESVRKVEEGGDPIGVEIADFSDVVALPDTVIDLDDIWQKYVPTNMGVSDRSTERA